MSGSFSPPVIFGALAAGQQNLSLFDTVFTSLQTYINTREITQDTLVNRPAAGISGRLFFATDTGALFADTGTAWTQIGIAPQAWIAPAFNAAIFTGGGAQTWTVGAADVLSFAYTVFGKTITVAFRIQQTSVGGVPDPTLQITIPGGLISNRSVVNTITVTDNGAATALGVAFVNAAGTVIQIQRIDGANWAAAANATNVSGEITFEVQ